MGSRSLKRCNLEDHIVASLAKNGIFTAKDLLLRDRLVLQDLLDVTSMTVQQVLLKVSESVAPQPVAVTQIQQRFLPTQLQDLDKALNGGLPSGVVTEVVGCSGLGKTQFCCTAAVLNHYVQRGRTVYVDTENAFQPQRLCQIATARFPHLYGTSEALKDLATGARTHERPLSLPIVTAPAATACPCTM